MGWRKNVPPIPGRHRYQRTRGILCVAGKHPKWATRHAVTSQPENRPTALTRSLGYGGLIPFVGLAMAMWWLPQGQQATAALALLAYGATILSFMGAIHWGLTMREASGPSAGMLLWGVTPSLIAWVGLLLPVAPGLLLVAAVLWICFAVDRRVYPATGLREWLPMRLHLTIVASACCIAGAVRISGVSS